ncbi:hypothetical protein [Pontimicrobium sp. MEBiC06410]
MKVYFTYILFLAFALRPVYNLGYVAYFELNIDYIIETYCVNKEKPQLQCNGKCHLAKQLTLNATDVDETNTTYLATFFEAFFPVYFQEYNYNYKLKSNAVVAQNNWSYNNQFLSLFKDCIDPPPRLI